MAKSPLNEVFSAKPFASKTFILNRAGAKLNTHFSFNLTSECVRWCLWEVAIRIELSTLIQIGKVCAGNYFSILNASQGIQVG
jgi:hypothetical protein